MIDKLIEEINKALENELYFSALSLALTLPDICGKAEYPDKGSTSRYQLWYDEYIGQYENPTFSEKDIDEDLDNNIKEELLKTKNMPYLSGEVVYNFRCSLFHQGNPNLDEIEYEKRKKKKCPIDKFVVVVEKEKPFHIYSGECSSIVSDNEGHQTRSYRLNVRRLCMIICLTAGKYYRDNKEKFTFFNYSILDWDEEMKKCCLWS